MYSRRLLGFFVAAIAVLTSLDLVCAARAAGQQDAAPAVKVTSLALGSLKSPPGNQVFIPMMLAIAGTPAIGTIVSQVTFPNKLVSFEGATSGLPADLVKIEISAVVEADDKDPANSILKVTLVSEKGETIPSGVLAYLGFKVSDRAPLGQAISLKSAVSALTSDDPPKPVGPIVAKDGEIEVKVSDNPFYACFFYMH